MLGEVYRSIKRKDILHLAVLMHDLGKGQEEDHSEVGKRLAEEDGGPAGIRRAGNADAQLSRASPSLDGAHRLSA